eukprot:6201817-Pleurochrysis_carterae.AAC.4
MQQGDTLLPSTGQDAKIPLLLPPLISVSSRLRVESAARQDLSQLAVQGTGQLVAWNHVTCRDLLMTVPFGRVQGYQKRELPKAGCSLKSVYARCRPANFTTTDASVRVGLSSVLSGASCGYSLLRWPCERRETQERSDGRLVWPHTAELAGLRRGGDEGVLARIVGEGEHPAMLEVQKFSFNFAVT